MWSRKRLEIGWLDLLYAVAACLRGRSADAISQRLAQWWSPRDDALVCLSVRSGFDLWLQAMALPAGSEILVSALTIPDMVRLIEAHGLAPVPIDVDPATLTIEPVEVEQSITPRTRAILVAHLFGTRPDIDAVVDVARRHGLLVVEDCAQAFCGPQWTGHKRADVAMFSFGPIKTQTSLGGGLVRVANAEALERMRHLQRNYEQQPRKQYLARVLKYSVFKVLSLRLPYACVWSWCRWRGRDADSLVHGSVRGFAGGDLLRAIRRRPSAPLVRLLERRLMSFHADRLHERSQRAALLRLRLAGCVELPGEHCSDTTDWVFSMLCSDPARMVGELRAAGFDAARSHSLCVVPPPSDEFPQAAGAGEWLARLVLLPCYAEMPLSEIERMADVVRRAARATAGSHVTHPQMLSKSTA